MMVNIGTQTLGSKPLSKGPVVFISSIKNENAFTQCYIPLGTDACTLAEDLAIDSLRFVAKEKNTASLNLRRRRGRPRKNPILIDDSFRIKTGNNVLEGHTGKATDELVLNRVKRERKIPIKFDPSDVNKTKATSLPASESIIKSEVEETENISENDKPLESDSDWTDEELSTSTAYDSDDQLHTIFQIPEGASKKGLITKCLQDNQVDQVFHGQSTEKKVSEVEIADEGTKGEIIINDKGKICSMHLQTDKRKRIVDLSGNKRQAKRKKGCRPYTCKHCNIDFTLFSVYTKHMLNHEIAQGKHSVTCKMCGKILSSRVNLRRHMMIHKGKPFTCEMCGKGFTGRYLLREHLTVEHNQVTSNSQTPTNHQCHACKKYMSTKTALQYHQARLHSCVKCEKKWPCKTSLREHVLQIHDQVNVTKEGRLECSYCNKTFNYRYHYLNHVAHHSDEKNFVCQKCKKGFLTRQALYCHTKQVHEKYNYRYPCSVCEKVFICNAKLVEHIRTHTGEKPFECTLCSVAFAAKATYKSHMKLVHSQTSKQRRGKRSKDTPLLYEYNCPLCDIKDLRADELEGHCWNVHNATVQFSFEMPEKLSTQDTVVLDGSRNIVLSNQNIAAVEASKEMPEKLPAKDTVVLGGSKNIVLSNKNIAAVEASKEMPEKLPAKNTVVLSGSKNTVLSNKNIAVVEASKEIVVSEGSTEIVVSDGATDIFLLEESKELVVAGEENINLTVTSES